MKWRSPMYCDLFLGWLTGLLVGLLLLVLLTSQALSADAINIRTIDGDTFSADIEIGFGIVLKDQTVRIYNFDAWESKKIRRSLELTDKQWEQELPKGKAAKIALENILMLAKRVEVREVRTKDDPFGRLILEVYADGKYVADEMRRKGHERKAKEAK